MDQNYNNQNNNQYNQYAQPQQYNAVAQAPVEDKAAKITGLISFILGIVSLVTCCSGWSFGIAGIILSCISKKRQPDNPKAKTGFVLSLIGTILGVVFFILYIILVAVGAVASY